MRGALIEPPPPPRPWYRRLPARAAGAVLVVILIAGAAALLRDGAPDTGAATVGLASTTPTAEASAVATAAIASTPVPITITFDPPDVGRGETSLLVVRRPGAVSGSVVFLGHHYPLERDGDTLWAPLGAGLVAPLGPQVAVVTTRDATGATLETAEVPFAVVEVDRPVDYLELTEEEGSVLTPEAVATEARMRTFEQFNAFDGRAAWNDLFIRPAEGIVTTQFGQARSINGGPIGGAHGGLDIANAEGTPVVSAAPGRVIWAAPMPIRGNTVLVDHGAGVVTGYHHLLEITTEAGARVEAGEVIALMGSTGLSTGPHLHWEMTIYGVNVDPVTWTERPFRPE